MKCWPERAVKEELTRESGGGQTLKRGLTIELAFCVYILCMYGMCGVCAVSAVLFDVQISYPFDTQPVAYDK